MFAIVLLLTLSADACRELCRSDAVDHYARLNALASTTRYELERAAFLVRRPDGRLTTVAWQAGDRAEASYTGRIPLRWSPSFTHIRQWRRNLRSTTWPKLGGSDFPSS